MAAKPKPSRARANAKSSELAPFVEDGTGETLTTNQGLRIQNNQDTLKAGERGPSLLEDFHFREKITHFDHERIPERVVHARGSAAHGYFQVYESLAKYTRAGFLQDPAARTPVFVRFSTVAGSRGSTDLARDVRGFAVKFYTDEGELRPGGEQHPRLLHPGRDQVPGPGPCGQAGAGQRDAPGRLRPRHLLGLHLADAGVHAHDHVGHVGPGHSAQLPHDGGFRRPHLPPRERQGQVPLREVPLEAAAGRALRGLGRGAEDLRQGSRLPPARPLGGDRVRHGPAVGARPADRRGGEGARLRLRPPRPHQDHPRGARARPARGPPDPGPQPGQLLRGDRAGRLPSRPHRARHRLHQRPAAPGAALLLHGHPAPPAGRAQLPRDPDQPARRARAQPPARRPHAPDDQPRQGRTTSPTPSAAAARCRRRGAAGGFVSFPEPDAGAEGARPLGEVLRPLQPGRAVLQQPVRAGEGPHRGGAALRARQGRALRHPRADGRDARPRRRHAGRARGGGPGAPRQPEDRAAPQPQHPRRTRIRSCASRARSRTPVDRSEALSMANTVKDTIATRKVAILAADGVDEPSLDAHDQGAQPRGRPRQDRGAAAGLPEGLGRRTSS